ncbi:hypothetical protein DICVIV_13607 [Dictyocaulus viviparus]|uniref:Uncharacterized protein n=1 Tax=Dictyocaulus viviparus TaxID=29172 RepID=A0A0D8X9I6_DICVI|nr:hypothetical protein DICVIV_13607 [Dictyocaulus viviparus]
MRNQMLCDGDEDDALRMRWALVCSVSDGNMLNTLSDFAVWFLAEVSKVASKMNIYAKFENRPKAVLHVPVGNFDACSTAYEDIRKNWPAVMFVLHILPKKSSAEYEWMRMLSTVHGFIRQGVLLDNALDKFSTVVSNGEDIDSVYRNVAQWIARATSRLCLDKNSTYKPYDLRVGSGKVLPNNVKFDQDAIQTAVHIVLSSTGNLPHLYREEFAVRVTGFPPSLNEFGVAQLFHGLKVTGVSLKIDSAIVTFTTKFLALQACALDSKKIDRIHTLHVEPLFAEIKEQLDKTELRMC